MKTEAELSYAYLHAVAAQAGMSCEVSGRHADKMGVDATIRAVEKFDPNSLLTDFALDVQLKATIQDQKISNDRISYYLKGIDRYDKLRKKTVVPPRIMVVLFLPKEKEKWLQWSEDELALRKCAWWVSLRDAKASNNESGQTVYLPKDQLFHSEGLREIMKRLSLEEELIYAD